MTSEVPSTPRERLEAALQDVALAGAYCSVSALARRAGVARGMLYKAEYKDVRDRLDAANRRIDASRGAAPAAGDELADARRLAKEMKRRLADVVTHAYAREIALRGEITRLKAELQRKENRIQEIQGRSPTFALPAVLPGPEDAS